MDKAAIFKRTIIILLFPLALFLLYLTSKLQNFTENLYSNIVFRFIGQILSTITGFVPFSIAEIIVIVTAISALCYIILAFYRTFKYKEYRRKVIIKAILNISATAAAIYFLFLVLWGFNYNRAPFAQSAGLEVRPASTSELAVLCESLIQKVNNYRSRVRENENGIMMLNDNGKAALRRAYKGYEAISAQYTSLGGRFGRPKPVMLSELMCYTGITGVYFPFTAEANVNMKNTDAMLPATMCHEMAHQRGFAREDEANFIAYLACRAHPDDDFIYSGYLLAVINSVNALYGHDRDKALKVMESYSSGIKRDLRYMSEFWARYEGPVEKISSSINDTYLKANLQEDGVYSYGRMVDLLLAEYLKNPK